MDIIIALVLDTGHRDCCNQKRMGLILLRCGLAVLWTGLAGLNLVFAAEERKPPSDFRLEVVWAVSQPPRTLKVWTWEEVRARKTVKSSEKDPESGQVVSWQGVSLEKIIEESMSALSVDETASIDLIVLKGAKGAQADIPRALAVKYPLFLAHTRDGRPVDGRGPLVSVIPWSTKDKLAKEMLPITKYFVSGVNRVELTNYQVWYPSAFFLRRRSDPLVIRGEKRFVQACAGCHGWKEMPKNPGLGDFLTQAEEGKLFGPMHQKVDGMPHFEDMDQRAIRSYLKAIQSESGGASADRGSFFRKMVQHP